MATGATTKYRADYCKRCITAGAEGYSLTAFAGMIGVSRTTLNRWVDRHSAFAEAVGAHKAKRARFWEDQLARIARDGGKTGSATMVMFALRNIAPEDYGERATEPPPAKPPAGGSPSPEQELSQDVAEKLKRILE